MATPIKKVVETYKSLADEWNKDKKDLKTCGILLQKLKMELINMEFLPTEVKSASKQELLVARDILEIGAQYSIAAKDIPSFERYMAQLKSYYFDVSADLPESSFKYQILGLNLLCLLAQNKLAEFHTELEQLPVTEIESNAYISHPVSMEQYMMEGSYHKVFLAKDNVPAPSYSYFMDILLQTTREEIASCLEKAYDDLDANETAKMLFYKNQKEIRNFASGRGWQLHGKSYIFKKDKSVGNPEVLSSIDLAKQVINYAKEMEMII